MIPIKVVIEQTDKALLDWSKESEGFIHKKAVEAAYALYENPQLDGLVVFEFYERNSDIIPFADVSVDRPDIEDCVTQAENYFVEIEDYESAEWVKNYRTKMNITNI